MGGIIAINCHNSSPSCLNMPHSFQIISDPILMTSLLASAAVAVYLLAFGYQVLQLRKQINTPTLALQLVTALAIVLHSQAVADLLFSSEGLDLSLLKIFALISLIINVVVFCSGLKKPIHSLNLLLFPISALTITAALAGASTKTAVMLAPSMQLHVLLSILAYSLLAIAALQAALMGYQNWQLKHKHQNLLMRTFPPLQSMEALLFELIWAGELILTLSLLSGFIFYDDFFAQKLLHKVVFSLVAWVFFGVLLWGRQVQGWRGKTAIRWTWAGFIAIVLGYVGSKVVLEFLLI
jgi:ABC-type uncharacterized transport system permease subunit